MSALLDSLASGFNGSDERRAVLDNHVRAREKLADAVAACAERAG